jgi:carboxyl-terminal processing protease
MKNPFTSWKKVAIGGAVISGCVGLIAAGDNYFEIGKNLEVFNQLYKELNIYYVDETNPGELMTTGIDAMLESLDPYTQYYTEEDMEDYRFQTTGQYGGIGAMIRTKSDGVMVSEPYEGYPAMKAGIRPGDAILEVDGRSTKGLNTDDVSKMLKGQAGTQVKVVTSRNGAEPVTHMLTREEIKIPDVPYKGFIDAEHKVGYLKLNSFTQTAGQEVRNAVKELKDQGATKLVLDLRGNGGGLLREAVNIVNLFVPKGEMVVETKGKIAEWDKSYKTLSEPLDASIPLVLLVDTGSASASEIVSGALQDLDRAVIVGHRTYGKGLVQQTRDLYYNTKLKVTVAKYYIPSGRCIQKVDYAHHDSTGKAVVKADSLIRSFKTRNGRPVIDGRGIAPDVMITEPELPKVVGGLFMADAFFDFANQYRWTHDTIVAPEKFVITDQIWNEFVAFVKSKDLKYQTETMDELAKLEATAKRERYYEHAKGAIEALRAEIKPERDEDMQLFRKDIEEILRAEIVGRYYFQSGRAKSMLVTDPYVLRAIEVLNGPDYAGILSGAIKTGN